MGPIYREFPNFQMTLYEGVGTNLTGLKAVDLAVLFAFDPMEPIDSIYAQLFYEEGTFLGGPVLPAMDPYMTYLRYTDYGASTSDYARAIAMPMSAVPEASTIGLMGGLGLGILAAVRRIRAHKRGKIAAANGG